MHSLQYFLIYLFTMIICASASEQNVKFIQTEAPQNNTTSTTKAMESTDKSVEVNHRKGRCEFEDVDVYNIML